MEVKVVKFGGSSLANAVQFQKVAEIVKAEPTRRYVVASAPGKRFSGDEKVTDLLYKCHDLVSNGNDFNEVFDEIALRYHDIVNDLKIDSTDLDRELDIVRANISKNPGGDYIASRGEYLNSFILAEYLGFDFIDAATVIRFNAQGTYDAETTNAILAGELKKHKYAVVPGFYGAMPDGKIKTFSRGGSDITGSIVARAAMADLYENWTDVSGFLMADPRCVENPKPIDVITYTELRELSYMGATVLHEDAIFPVRFAGIPINIKNTNAPADKGTMIVPVAAPSATDDVITGIAGKRGFSTISIEKDMMNSEYGFGRRVLEVLENNNLRFEHLPSSIDTMSVIVSTGDLEGKREKILDELCKAVNPDSISIEDGIALIAIVGRGMIKAKGTAARVFNSVAQASINIKMIDQGSSELNIIIGVEDADYINTIRAIYKEFIK